MAIQEPVHYESEVCSLSIASPAPGVVLVTVAGQPVGEFGADPLSELEKQLPESDPVELFIDARRARGASVQVSSDWAHWLAKHRPRFSHVNMLTGSQFIEITADFVRGFSNLEDVMQICRDEEEFEAAMASAVAATHSG